MKNKMNSTLANVSVILGVLGFVLPCLAFSILGFVLDGYLISKIGLVEQGLLNVCFPMALWIVGPIAIIVGILSLPKRDLGSIPEMGNKRAKIGIVLGVLTIPCVLLPLLLFLLLLYLSS
jgi:hypothetical protein